MNDGSDSESDRHLLRRFAGGGEAAAFASLVGRHSGLVFSTAVRRCGSPELAQEAAQNVFTPLARKGARLSVTASLAPWLHRAAVLEAAALLRRETRYRHAMKRREEDPTAQATDTPVADAWSTVRPVVDEALNALPVGDRRMLLLHHVEGRSYHEIAETLGMTEAAAQRRGHRALQKLEGRCRASGDLDGDLDGIVESVGPPDQHDFALGAFLIRGSLFAK